MQRTPLYDLHKDAGATFTEFAGYDMPVHFGSIREEHQTVRQKVGLFDVSHMSNLRITGDATAALARVAPADFAACSVGRGIYTVLMREDATILDDCFCFRLQEEEWFVIPNAGTNEAATSHIRQHAPGAIQVEDETQGWAILALQGPAARDVLAAASDDAGPRFHRITTMQVAGVECLVSGTGYTGEKGVELYAPAAGAQTVWNHIMECGGSSGIRPIGLGARDTLRLEKGFCLAGNEFAGGRTPLEASLGWLVHWDGDFLGKDRLLAQKGEDHARLMGLVQSRGIPRAGYTVHKDGEVVGKITSGTMSPTLGKGIALAYLRGLRPDDTVQVEVRGRDMDATVTKPPFA